MRDRASRAELGRNDVFGIRYVIDDHLAPRSDHLLRNVNHVDPVELSLTKCSNRGPLQADRVVSKCERFAIPREQQVRRGVGRRQGRRRSRTPNGQPLAKRNDQALPFKHGITDESVVVLDGLHRDVVVCGDSKERIGRDDRVVVLGTGGLGRLRRGQGISGFGRHGRGRMRNQDLGPYR